MACVCVRSSSSSWEVMPLHARPGLTGGSVQDLKLCSVLRFAATLAGTAAMLAAFEYLLTDLHGSASVLGPQNEISFAPLSLLLAHDAPPRHADLAYSDDYSASGSYTSTLPQPEYALTGVTQGQTYQPHWCAQPWRQGL